jgi:RNA polymerase sigma-70 factor (ECF subfamily)
MTFTGAVGGLPAIAGRGRAAARENAPDAEWAPPSWDEVVREHSGRVYRLAYRLTGNQHDAEDLTQEVFVRVFRSLSNYTPGTFEGWLHRITTNLFLDMARRRQRIRFEGLGDDAAERLQGREPTPAQAFDDRNFDADVQAALDALAPEYRAAVVLCDIEGLSYEEISATLGVKLGTVRSRIHRGRAQLRAALEHRAPRRRPALQAAAAAAGAEGPGGELVAAQAEAGPGRGGTEPGGG